jgi:hypothetical protein
MAASYLLSGTFWLQTLERAVKTFAQAAIALLSGDGFGLLQIDIGNVFSVAALAALVSVLTSIASGPFTSGNSPSLVPVPETRPGRPSSS